MTFITFERKMAAAYRYYLKGLYSIDEYCRVKEQLWEELA